MEIQISFYQEWMKSQVIELICNQYNYNVNEYEIFFNSFYNNAFQEKAIKIVALDNNKVIGFQSFFYWPYLLNGKRVNSYQSGNSIVSNNYRGKGIFQKMLNFIYENPTNIPIDFFIGFPVEASYKSFIKSKWDNPFNLVWSVKLNNPLSILFSINKQRLLNDFESCQTPNLSSNNCGFKLYDDSNFIKWRESYYKTEHYFFTYNLNGDTCQIGFKINIRRKYFKELIIGQINSNNYNESFIEIALIEFLKKIKKISFISFISIAYNPNEIVINNLVKKLKFKLTNKKIYFIIKDFSKISEIKKKSSWSIFRGDIDTW